MSTNKIGTNDIQNGSISLSKIGNFSLPATFSMNGSAGAFINFCPIGANGLVMFALFNEGGGGTYSTGWLYYDSTNGLMTSVLGNNVAFQYSAGQVQIRASNTTSYTMLGTYWTIN